MPCIFCIAVVALISGAIASTAVDHMENELAKKGTGPVRRAADTDSVTRWELRVRKGHKTVPVAVTLWKDHGRIRIQILSHNLTRAEITELEDEIAETVGAKVVTRSTEEEEARVNQAMGQEFQPGEPQKEGVTEPGKASVPRKERR
jgi:hypothetical protein